MQLLSAIAACAIVAHSMAYVSDVTIMCALCNAPAEDTCHVSSAGASATFVALDVIVVACFV